MSGERDLTTIEAIRELYQPTDKAVPVLDAAASLAVRETLETNNYAQVAGYWPDASGAGSGSGLKVTSGSIYRELQTGVPAADLPGAFFGPYFLGEQYIPQGLGVWASVDTIAVPGEQS